jgi:hypothetical protein
MRVVAFGIVGVLVTIAAAVYHWDNRPLSATVYARASGQRRMEALVAWVEGPTRLAPHGHLVVASALPNGRLQRFSSRPLPGAAADCRLWLEESPEVIQAVARCPGFQTLRLTADGRSVAPIGPVDRPGTLYDLYPLTSFEAGTIIQRVRPHEPGTHIPLVMLLLAGAVAVAYRVRWRIVPRPPTM